MALPSTIRRFTIELADVDRGVYETLDFRVPQHPSELAERVVTRVLAHCLLWERDLEPGTGLSTVEEPALWVREPGGGVALWVDVGAPSPTRLHRANKHATRVVVVSDKPQAQLRTQWAGANIHKAETIAVWLLPSALVTPLADQLERRVDWVVSLHEGQLTVSSGDLTVAADVAGRPLPDV